MSSPNLRAGALRQALDKILSQGGCHWSRQIARQALDADEEKKKEDLPDQERIVAAAIRMNENGLVLFLPQPARHYNVQEAAVRIGVDIVGAHEQGFVTSWGRFVRRSPARRIAKAAGQLIREPISNTFTTEELW